MMKRIIRKYFYHICMILICFVMVYPLLWMIFSSFKPESQIMLSTSSLIPEEFTLEHYIRGWGGFGRYTFATFFRNSLFVSIVRMIGTTVSCTLAAYGFSRINFPMRGIWFAIMISTMCLPGMVLQIPQYLLFNKFGWVGTYLPLLVPSFFGGAQAIFLLMQFIKTVPREMDEAAMIDGCGRFRMFFNIMLPLIRPCIVMTAVTAFIGSWGDFYSSLIYLNKPTMYPVAYALKLFADDSGNVIGPPLAMSVASLIPILILFAFFQKQLVEGISTTGVKG